MFLAKLRTFHQAFAARYDAQPWLVYVDVGSMGTWGEGHEWPAGKQATVEEIRRHLDLHLDCYRHTPLVATDELAHFDRPPEEEKAIRALVDERGLLWRDDTPMLGYFLRKHPDTFSVVRPAYFEDSYRQRPVILETDHYPTVKAEGNWKGPNGCETGADNLRGAIRVMHATYIGYHGLAREWLADNPEITVELANLCGYWFFPVSVTLQEEASPGETLPLEITWLNRGVAPAYHRYGMELRLDGPASHIWTAHSSDNRHWLPDVPCRESHVLNLPATFPAGSYRLSLRLTDPKTKRIVHVGLKAEHLDDLGFYHVASLNIPAKTKS